MVGAGRFFANACWEREVLRKRTPREGAPEAAGGRLGAAVPEARGHRRRGGRPIGKDGSSQEGEFGQPLAGLGRMDELTSGTDHLFCRQGELLYRPAVAVESPQHLGAAVEGGGEQQRLLVAWVVDDKLSASTVHVGLSGPASGSTRSSHRSARSSTPSSSQVVKRSGGVAGMVRPLTVRGSGRTRAPRVDGRPRPLYAGGVARRNVLFLARRTT